MAPEEESSAGTQAGSPASTQVPRRPRRPGRGHRGRGPRRGPRQPRRDQSQAPSAETTPAQEVKEAPLESAAESGFEMETETEARFEDAPLESDPGAAREEIERPSERPTTAPATTSRPHQPASRASIQHAIEQVNQIVQSLKEASDEMEGVLELLELFERQGDADEREIESLRRALRQIQRPRDGGHHSHRGH